MSATLDAGFLATTDRQRDHLDAVEPFDPRLDADSKIGWWRDARRPLDWFTPKLADTTERSLAKALAQDVMTRHMPGTLSLIICNTVEMAQRLFRELPDNYSKVLLTSRFRRQDRELHESALLEFEEKRKGCAGKPVPNHSGLICVSTQAIEAGVDVSAHVLWSELSPWPSVIQRLGRLNRDGCDPDAHAWFWESPVDKRMEHAKSGPYDSDDIRRARTLIEALRPVAKRRPFHEAISDLQKIHRDDLIAALQLKDTPMPRAIDVHSLFSTEPDVHGGFTDVSRFVRGTDEDADLTVFWREWTGTEPPRGGDLNGPDLDPWSEGCPVPFFRLRETLKTSNSRAWIWNEDRDCWEPKAADDLRPGMVVMLKRDAGGYDVCEGWTGRPEHVLVAVPPAGRGRTLGDDERTESGYWTTLDTHLADARREAELLCDGVGLRDDQRELKSYRVAVVEAAALHDLGKAHPQWQRALPAGLEGGQWAKCPRVLAVDVSNNESVVQDAVRKLRPACVALEAKNHKRGKVPVVRMRWAVEQKLRRDEIETLTDLPGVSWAGHERFLPRLRHEAASALAMWHRYRKEGAAYPALAVYLAAAHHGKVRTVLRSLNDQEDDVFGVPRSPDTLNFSGQAWPLDFSVSKDGAEGVWDHDRFVPTGYGWTGLVADLLGPWRSDDLTEVGAVPEGEPRRLGPFVLAYLEALVRVADWRASENPSQCKKPGEVRRDT
jgi:CRISPR-associated endonuclease/helicase Cas3